MIAQGQPLQPPTPDDKFLRDFAGFIQTNLRTLFGVAHMHVGFNGTLTSLPKNTDGTAGDIVIGKISGSIYLFVKTDRTTWYQFGPGTKV